jgi:Spy/CpxP family protein refolding chaperone
MRQLITALLLTVLAGSGLGITAPAMAAQSGMGQMHGKGYGMGYGGGWKASLTDEQRTQIAKLKLSYKQKAIPLKLQIKQARVELAMLITSAKPDNKAIDKKIDQIVNLKARKMRLKADMKIAIRKLLNDDQKVMFDMKMLKKAYHGGKGGGHGRGGGHH